MKMTDRLPIAVMCSGLLHPLLAGWLLATPQNEHPSAAETAELGLDGVIVARNPASSVALVRHGAASRARPVRIGQAIGGYVLAEVTRESVLFRSAGGELRIFVGSAASPEPAAREEETWDRRELDRAEARGRLEREIPVILDETRLTPHVVEGEVRGLTLDRLPDGTLLGESGLLPGDLLVSLNGEPLHSLTELWGLLARLGDVEELRLIVERGGEELRLAYALTR